MSSFEHSLAIPIYSETNSPNELKIFGPNPWDVKSITWSRFNKGEMIGGSSVNYKSENAFYFAAGGICSSVEKNINLYGVKNGVLSIAYKIPI